MPHLVAAKMVGTAGGATRASASAAAVEFTSWCSRRSAEPPSSSASEGRLPSPAAPAGDPPVQRASSPDVTVPVASALSVHASQSRGCTLCVCNVLCKGGAQKGLSSPGLLRQVSNQSGQPHSPLTVHILADWQGQEAPTFCRGHVRLQHPEQLVDVPQRDRVLR